MAGSLGPPCRGPARDDAQAPGGAGHRLHRMRGETRIIACGTLPATLRRDQCRSRCVDGVRGAGRPARAAVAAAQREAKVSQSRTSPRCMPRRSQATRCSLVPCVKASGTT